MTTVMDIEQARFNMIEQQIRPWDVLNTAILDLYQSMPREAFVSESDQALAFADIELPIGHAQTMMSPKVEARMLQALDISKSAKILEIGTGSGFITACWPNFAKHAVINPLPVPISRTFAFLDISSACNMRASTLGDIIV